MFLFGVWVLFYFLYVGAADGPVIPGIIVTRIIFFKITLKAIQVLLPFWKPSVPDDKKMVNAKFAAKGFNQYTPFLPAAATSKRNFKKT